MVQHILKRTIFVIVGLLPFVVLFFFFSQTDAHFIVQTDTNENTQPSEDIQSDVSMPNLQIQEIIQNEAELKDIPIESMQIVEEIPSYVLLITTVAVDTPDQGTKNQTIQVLLDVNPTVIETQLHRLELVLKGVEFSKMSEEIQEIDVRFKLPVLRTQKTSINT
jgi:hypothetical protein